MTPQGSSIINTEYFDNLIQSVENVQTCEELQKIASDAMATIGAVNGAITEEMAKLAPILALLTAPGANLTQIVTWITSLINGVLRPMYEPYITYQAQIVALTAKVAQLTSAINDAKSRIPHCSFTTPTP